MRAPGIRLAGLVVGWPRGFRLGPLEARFEGAALLALLGPNGCGKSTLLRTVLGLQRPLAGTVEAQPAGAISYVPQSTSLGQGVPATAEEVVLMATSAGRAARRDQADRALGEVEASGLRRRRFSKLSGGERQRVLIARALVPEAPILLLDEPTGSLDPESSARIWDLLRGLADAGRLVLAATHDPEGARARADRCLVLGPRGLDDQEAGRG